jgi:hypothetical protein
LAVPDNSARAIQAILVEIKHEGDGTFTGVFKTTTDSGVRVEGGTEAPSPDFFTIYNFAVLVADSNEAAGGLDVGRNKRRIWSNIRHRQ